MADSVSDVNPMALLELTVEGSEEEKEIDSDVEFIDEIPNEKDLQYQVEQVFNYPHVPLFDLTQEEQPPQTSLDGREVTKKKGIKTTPDERTFRRNFFKENPHVGKFRVHCTICDVHLGTAAINGARVKVHLALGVLVCSKCYKCRIVDNYKDLTTCNWCYTRLDKHGDEYIRCTKCCGVFCQVCVERNLGKDVCKELDQSPNWECFMCEPRQIWPHRVIAVALVKHLYRVKANHLKYPEECLKDRAECCKEKQQNGAESTSQVAGSTSQAAGSALQVAGPKSQVGIAMPRYKSPPPLLPMPSQQPSLPLRPKPPLLQMPPQPPLLQMPPQPPILQMPPQPHNVPVPQHVRTYTIIDQNREKRQVFVPAGNTNISNVQFTSQPQNPILVQSTDGTIQIDPDIMKQMFLQGNQSVTLNTGPQVIHNVYHNNKRLVLLNQEPNGKTVSILKSTPEHYNVQNRNLSNSGEMNRIQVTNRGKSAAFSQQMMGQENQIKIVHAGTLIDKNNLIGDFDDTTNPTPVLNSLPVNNKSSTPSTATLKKPPTVNRSLTPLILRKSSEQSSNTGHASGNNTHREYPEKVSNKSENISKASSYSRPAIQHCSVIKSNNSSTIIQHQKAKCVQENSNLPFMLNNNPTQKVLSVENSENINTHNTARKTIKLSSLLEAILIKDKEPDPLKVTDDDDDVVFVENDQEENEINDPIINFVDVQSSVEEINIKQILATGDSNRNQSKQKEKVVEPTPKIKIKAIEELIHVNNDIVETSKINCKENISDDQNLEETVNLRSLKIGMDGVQRVLISLIKSIRAKRSTLKTYTEYKCESSVAAKLISSIQKELQMCTRQLNVIQSNIYEYYKDVAGVLEPSDIDDIKVNKAETDLPVLSKSCSVGKNENNITTDIDITTENVPNTNTKKSTNYHENFTKFLSSYNNLPVDKNSPSKINQTETNFQNNFDDSVIVGKHNLKRKRPKLNFDLSNKRSISGSPIVTEDDLMNKNSRSSSSYETPKRSVKNKLSSQSYCTRFSKVLKKYKIKQCSVLLHRLDPRLIRLHQTL